MQISLLTVLAALATGAAAALLAKRKKRNPYIWFLIGSFFGLMGAFAIFFMSNPKKNLTTDECSPSKPTPRIQGPSDKFWYYLNEKREQIGPMSLNALTGLLYEAKISKKTYVWNEELPDWKPLEEMITNSP